VEEGDPASVVDSGAPIVRSWGRRQKRSDVLLDGCRLVAGHSNLQCCISLHASMTSCRLVTDAILVWSFLCHSMLSTVVDGDGRELATFFLLPMRRSRVLLSLFL